MSVKMEILRKIPFKTGIKKIWRRNLLPEQGWESEGEGLLGAITDDWSDWSKRTKYFELSLFIKG